MLSPRCGRSLALLASALLAGCSSTGRAPFGGGPNSRSVAVIGDHPASAATGEPGARVATEVDEIDLASRPSSRARISGRVLDDRGRPVPDATVRLADGMAKGGRDLRTSTDRSGAFTLTGLRPDATYTLIAEADDDRGPIRGSAEARTSETGVEIALAAPEGGAAPRASRARAISKRTESDADESVTPASDEGFDAIEANGEDLGASADEAGSDDIAPPARTRSARPRLSSPTAGSGWRKPGAAPAPVAESQPSAATPRSDEPLEEYEPEELNFDPVDDGPNPLPPAIEPENDEPESDEPEEAAARPARRTKVGRRNAPADDADAGGMMLAAAPTGRRRERSLPTPEDDIAASAPIDEAGAMPSTVATSLPDMPPTLPGSPAPSAEPEGAGLPEMPSLASTESPPPEAAGLPAGPSAGEPPPEQSPLAADAVPLPASEPVFASEGPAPAKEAPASPEPEYNPFANPFVTQPARNLGQTAPASPVPSAMPGPSIAMDVKPPTARPSAPPPADPALPSDTAPSGKVTWGELPKVTPVSSLSEPAPAARTEGKARTASARSRSAKKDEATSLCTYDAKHHKLVDFRLPDLEGNPVQLKDLDADYVLLDFWGTWCKPCLDSVPHLVELQKKFGPGRLKVVGIACEQDDPKLRRAKVEEMSRKLGINYAVLLSGMDGPCPLQEALHIQAFPTMIVLDRSGTIVWRDQGATPATLARLERVLSARTARLDTVRR